MPAHPCVSNIHEELVYGEGIGIPRLSSSVTVFGGEILPETFLIQNAE